MSCGKAEPASISWASRRSPCLPPAEVAARIPQQSGCGHGQGDARGTQGASHGHSCKPCIWPDNLEDKNITNQKGILAAHVAYPSLFIFMHPGHFSADNAGNADKCSPWAIKVQNKYPKNHPKTQEPFPAVAPCLGNMKEHRHPAPGAQRALHTAAQKFLKRRKCHPTVCPLVTRALEGWKPKAGEASAPRTTGHRKYSPFVLPQGR